MEQQPLPPAATHARCRCATQWNVRRRKVATAACSLSGTRGQQLNSTPPLNEVMKYAIPSLLVVVVLKYQGTLAATTLFTEDPVPTSCFLTSNCVYWLLAGMIKRTPHSDSKCFQWLIQTALAAGLLSVFSLISMSLPHKVWFVALVIWLLLLPVVLAWPLFYSIYSCAKKRIITSAVNKILALKIWPGGRSTAGVTRLPV